MDSFDRIEGSVEFAEDATTPTPEGKVVNIVYLVIIRTGGMGKSYEQHRWELPGNYPVFTVVMVIYHYVERMWRIIVTLIFYITYIIINIYYLGEPVNIHIQ